MAAKIITTADAIVTALNGASLSQSFTAVRHYGPSFDLKDMGTLHVSVVPKAIDLQMAHRSLLKRVFLIDIGIQQKVAGILATRIEDLLELTEEILDFVRTNGPYGGATWMGAENNIIYVPDELKEFLQFTSIATVTLMEIS